MKDEEKRSPEGEGKLSDEELEQVSGGVPNAGATNTVIIQTGSALVSNNPSAIASSSS